MDTLWLMSGQGWLVYALYRQQGTITSPSIARLRSGILPGLKLLTTFQYCKSCFPVVSYEILIYFLNYILNEEFKYQSIITSRKHLIISFAFQLDCALTIYRFTISWNCNALFPSHKRKSKQSNKFNLQYRIQVS